MRIRTLFLGALAMLAAASSALPVAAQQQPAGQKFGDWTLDCNGEGDKKVCLLGQYAFQQGGERPILALAAGYLGGKGQAALEITVPLASLLGPGVGLKVDEGQPVIVPFLRCMPHGCVALLGLDDKVLGTLKGGSKAQVAFMAPNGQQITVPVSLSGFTAGFNALPKK